MNCIPVFIASDPEWQRRFERRNLPIIGDEHPAFFASSRATLNITRADMARMGGVRRGASSKPPRVKRRFSPMRGKA